MGEGKAGRADMKGDRGERRVEREKMANKSSGITRAKGNTWLPCREQTASERRRTWKDQKAQDAGTGL